MVKDAYLSHAQHEPNTFAHFFINKLSIISGQCQLLREDLPKDVPEYLHCLERLLAIQDTANVLLDEIKANQDRLDSMKKAG